MTFTSLLTATLISHNASDTQVARAAWVSTLGEEAEDREPTIDRVTGLVGFLMGNRHGTPFEHNSFTFLVKAPIAVFREFHRHRVGWSYNEQSGRYSVLKPEFYVPPRHRPLVQVGKPGHYTFVPGDDVQHLAMTTAVERLCTQAYKEYEDMLEAGIAKEVARGVLPVYLYSSMYATCNARSLMNFLSLRSTHRGATFPSFPMWEIEQVAIDMEHEFARIMPVTWRAFRDMGSVSP